MENMYTHHVVIDSIEQLMTFAEWHESGGELDQRIVDTLEDSRVPDSAVSSLEGPCPEIPFPTDSMLHDLSQTKPWYTEDLRNAPW